MLDPRPGTCPDCGDLLYDEFTWTDSNELRVSTMCSDCGWFRSMSAVVHEVHNTEHGENATAR